MLLTRRIHPVLGREELRSVTHSGPNFPAVQLRRLPGSMPTFPDYPTLPVLAGPPMETQEVWALLCPPILGGLEMWKQTETLFFLL